ncbi:MAG: TIGR00725 family protein [Nitrososphaerota archaeon]
MAYQILVVGYNEDSCTDIARALAYEVGAEIARRGCILVTGGLGGVMAAAARGARENGGITVSILPQKETSAANPYSTVKIATGLSHMRNMVNVWSSDGVIVVGGGAGTLIEVAVAYLEGKPIVAVSGSGGVADEYAGKYLDDRQRVLIHRAGSPREAVEKVIRLASEGQQP